VCIIGLCRKKLRHKLVSCCFIAGLRGIPHPCTVGYLTLLERLRYCTVGSFLKRPTFPIWLLGSETHLSVVFSFECSLVVPNDTLDHANKVFDKFDPEGTVSDAQVQRFSCNTRLAACYAKHGCCFKPGVSSTRLAAWIIRGPQPSFRFFPWKFSFVTVGNWVENVRRLTTSLIPA